MRKGSPAFLAMIGLLTGLVLAPASEAMADEIRVRAATIAIEFESNADAPERRVSEVLQRRIMRRSQVRIGEAVPEADLRIVLGRVDPVQQSVVGRAARHGVRLPGVARTAPESYAVRLVEDSGTPLLLAVGADERGLLYAAGEVLRQFEYGPDHVTLGPVDIQAAPAYRYRGSSANQGGTMREITGARGWTSEEWQDYMLDFALSGANIGYGGGAQFTFLHDYGLMTVGGCRPNQYKGEIPDEWKAGGLEGWEGTDWVCPSVPEARAALMAEWDERFAQIEDHDILRFYAGDPGGCRCDRCMPWGKGFVELCEEVAAIWHKHHPETIVEIANQDLTNEGDRAVFAYLNEKPRDWVQGIAYGPGSNALSTYFRDELREDLFEYPGTGPVNRYLAEILNNLPRQQTITHYSDITHWISSQYQLEHPDPHLVKAYNRRTFHTRPRAYYEIFQDIMPFSQGDIIYSEGYHDEFHQYMWNRLLWNPNRSLEDVMAEYCTYHFGKAAAPLMAAAMLQLEQNLEAPLAENEGIDQYYLLVKEAGWTMPAHLAKDNYRWMLHMQKAAMDKYYQLKLRREIDREAALESLAKGDVDVAVAQGTALIAESIETPEMAALKEEAGRLGEDSDRIMGVRNVGYFNTEKPLTALAWTESQFKKAADANPEEQAKIIRDLATYTDPGPGGFYDDAGEPGQQPHLVKGESFDGSRFMDPENRPSQNTLTYSLAEDRGVEFRYTGLDPAASYKVRLTLVAPKFRAPEGGLQKHIQHLLADGEYVVRDMEVPVFTAAQVEYAIPATATADGALTLTFERAEGARGIMVSEVWLEKQ